MSKILLIRFSALGDVAMTVPIVYALATRYPEMEITVLSKPFFAPLFERLPENVRFFKADLAKKYKGVKGLTNLLRELKAMHFDYVGDLHNVLRTKYLRFFLCLFGCKVAVINKDRVKKKQLVRRENKIFEPLKTSFERYKDVLLNLGFVLDDSFVSLYDKGEKLPSKVIAITSEKLIDTWIGVAPFAKHRGKIYPLPLMEQVIDYFSKKNGTKVFLFGGGLHEAEVFDAWVKKYPNVLSLAGKINLSDELVLINQMDIMLSMDSANMHLASLVNSSVVSIWGATHPYAGFMGWKQSLNNSLQVDLACRPCSVFGQKPCFRRDYACLNGISPKEVIDKVESLLR